MRCVLVLILLGFVTSVFASVPSARLDEFIATEMPKAGAPGLAYAVTENGEISSDAQGEILIGSGREVSPETPFVIGSISKSFTALAVMQLVEAGQVDLNAGISQYLPVFSDRPSGAITIRQLLSHTSGYSTFQGNDRDHDGAGSAGALSRHVERIAQWTPAYTPETRWDYSNANYYVLGALIEAVSGRGYASYIESEILEPAGMAHSFVADGESHDIAAGHLPWFGAKRPAEQGGTDALSAPVGGVIASAGDIALYMTMMMNGEDDIISAESKAQMMRPASSASPFYGFGWYIDAANGTVSHAGTTPGVETLAVMVPAERKGVVVLVNAGSGMGFGENGNLISGISTIALGEDYAGDSGRWSRMALFGMFVLMPVVFGIGIFQAVFGREKLRAKSGMFGAFSMWFPLLITIALAWTCVWLLPSLFGVSMGTLRVYSPDLALCLVASAAAGVTWALVRLGVHYLGR